MVDSFESIIDDSQLIPCDYSRKRGFGPGLNSIRCRGCMFVGLGPCDKKMKQDLVRRCEEVYLHIQKFTGIQFKTLRAEHSFEYLMFDHVRTKGKYKGIAGYGWPRPRARWCTSKLKTEVIKKHLAEIKQGRNVVQCVGIAADEPHRVREHRYPLVEYGIRERLWNIVNASDLIGAVCTTR